MSRSLNVHLLPSLTTPAALAGSTVVVIDVLRATTTIATALAAGATAIVPVLEVEEARRQAAKLGGTTLLGGERGGVAIPGFDLGNSPADYTSARVAGRTIVFTTTNGTKAMRQGELAGRVLLAAFVNLSAVCRELSGAERIEIVCAGTENEITREDVLLAGAITVELADHSSPPLELNDQAQIAADAWRIAANELASRSLADRLRDSRGGRNVLRIGQERDIDLAATLDQFDTVPILDPQTWTIRLP